MTDRPILFSGPMVRAILEGRKTQTRRELKPQPPRGWPFLGIYAPGLTAVFDGGGKDDHTVRLPSRKDRFWVRETHYSTHRSPVDGNRIYYRADCDDLAEEMLSVRWSPSIHMPRWASRLTLTVTDVKVERLQDISEADAEAEGPAQHPNWPDEYYCTWSEAFRGLWNTIHGPEAWDANPWVCALTFTAEHRNIDA